MAGAPQPRVGVAILACASRSVALSRQVERVIALNRSQHIDVVLVVGDGAPAVAKAVLQYNKALAGNWEVREILVDGRPDLAAPTPAAARHARQRLVVAAVTAAQAAAVEYLLLLDGDVLPVPNTLQTLVRAAGFGYGLVYCPIAQPDGVYPPTNYADVIATQNVLTHWGCLLLTATALDCCDPTASPFADVPVAIVGATACDRVLLINDRWILCQATRRGDNSYATHQRPFYTLEANETVLEEPMPRTLDNVSPETAKKNVPDLFVYGDPNAWKCVAKASSKSQDWMRSTKAMEVAGLGVIVQVSTLQSGQIAEAVCFVPGAFLQQTPAGNWMISGPPVEKAAATPASATPAPTAAPAPATDAAANATPPANAGPTVTSTTAAPPAAVPTA